MKKKMFYWLAFLVVLLVFTIWLYAASFNNNKEKTYGVTFSQNYAEDLGLDWRQAYTAILDDLKVRNFRLIAYWNRIEETKGEYDFSDLDWQINEAAKRNAKVILAIGQRVPRWPECFIPDWAKTLSVAEEQKAVLEYLNVIINHYKKYDNIITWQVENEPLLSLFGECPIPDFDFYKKEVAYVKSLDNRSIMVTDSGELSLWLRTSRVAEILGTSIYRSVYSHFWGYFSYFYPPSFYDLRAKLVNLLHPQIQKIIISEFQFEPWARISMVDLPIEEQYKSFDLKKFDDNLKFIKRTGFDEAYLWGVEWWYWLKEKKGINNFWEQAKTIPW